MRRGALRRAAVAGSGCQLRLFCFAITFARVLSNPLASTSVIILVLYFAGYGGNDAHAYAGRAGMR